MDKPESFLCVIAVKMAFMSVKRQPLCHRERVARGDLKKPSSLSSRRAKRRGTVKKLSYVSSRGAKRRGTVKKLSYVSSRGAKRRGTVKKLSYVSSRRAKRRGDLIQQACCPRLRLLRYARNDTKGDFSFIVVCSSGDNCCENRLRDDEKTSSVSSRGTKCRGDLVNMTAGTVKDCFAALALITCGAGYDK